jgi:hypothetical protein
MHYREPPAIDKPGRRLVIPLLRHEWQLSTRSGRSTPRRRTVRKEVL